LLITSHFDEFVQEFPHEALANEYHSEDVNHLVDVVRSDSGISTLHEATGGDPSRSPRWQTNMVMGGDQELVARLQTRGGEAWGASAFTVRPVVRCSRRRTRRSLLQLAPS
jgi:hypothetical protein